jgi:hypothetical protein
MLGNCGECVNRWFCDECPETCSKCATTTTDADPTAAYVAVKPLDPDFAELAAFKAIGKTPVEIAEIVRKIEDGRMIEIPDWPVSVASKPEPDKRWWLCSANWYDKTITFMDMDKQREIARKDTKAECDHLPMPDEGWGSANEHEMRMGYTCTKCGKRVEYVTKLDPVKYEIAGCQRKEEHDE